VGSAVLLAVCCRGSGAGDPANPYAEDDEAEAVALALALALALANSAVASATGGGDCDGSGGGGLVKLGSRCAER
jgi:hypothetical protein